MEDKYDYEYMYNIVNPKYKEIEETLEKITEDRTLLFNSKNKNLETITTKRIKKIEEDISKELIPKQFIEDKREIINYKLNIIKNLKKEPELSNEILDLYNVFPNKHHGGIYYIYLHNETKKIGEINCYAESHYDLAPGYPGTISAKITPEYRGNNYTLCALNLLAEKLHNEDIKEVYISALKNNIPSIKTIEKFGGELSEYSYGNIMCYRCDIEKIAKRGKTK